MQLYFLIADIAGVFVGCYAAVMVVRGARFLLTHRNPKKIPFFLGDMALLAGSVSLTLSPWGWIPWMHFIAGFLVNALLVQFTQKMGWAGPMWLPAKTGGKDGCFRVAEIARPGAPGGEL